MPGNEPAYRSSIRRRLICWAFRTTLATAALCAWLSAGCASLSTDLSLYIPTVEGLPEVYDDRSWATVLRENVNDGVVDYEHLASHARPLQVYLQLIARVGPVSTPTPFAEPGDRVSYYANAYNAGVLAAVLYEKVPPTMYPVGRSTLDRRYRLRVDGRTMLLADLRAAAREASDGDARIEFALCGAARGSAPLSNQPLRGPMLERQLEALARSATSQPHLVQIDHEAQRLLVGLPIAEQREAFLAYHSRTTTATPATLLGTLLQLAEGTRREWLNTAVGYREGVIPFKRALNGRQ
ncbi:MAG: DUF547 domain-containing protein [bacterium]|nr:DUF547 domain-containing protein [bacterium]